MEMQNAKKLLKNKYNVRAISYTCTLVETGGIKVVTIHSVQNHMKVSPSFSALFIVVFWGPI